MGKNGKKWEFRCVIMSLWNYVETPFSHTLNPFDTYLRREGNRESGCLFMLRELVSDMDEKEIIFVLNSMRKHVTNSMTDSEILHASRENEALDYAIKVIKEKHNEHRL